MEVKIETLNELELTIVSGGEGEGSNGGDVDPTGPSPLPGFGGGEGLNCHDDPASVICPDPLP